MAPSSAHLRASSRSSVYALDLLLQVLARLTHLP